MLCVLMVSAAVLVGASPASAHARLVETWPVAGEVVPTAPPDVRMKFDEAITLAPESLLLLDFEGKPIATDKATHEDGRANTARITLPPDLADGTYVVSWRIGSADSHIVAGAFRFSIGAPSAVVIDPSEREPDRTVPVLQGVARGIAFAGLAVFLGGLAFCLVIWPGARGTRRARILLGAGWIGLVIGTIATLLLQGAAMTGRPVSALSDLSLSGVTMKSRLGPALLVRLGIAVLLAGLAIVALRRSERRTWLLVAVSAGAVGLVGTWTWADHSRTGIQQALAVPAATLHLLAMALWLGGLALLVATAVRAPADEDGTWAGIERFSRLATGCWVALAVTGIYLSWRQIGTAPALVSTNFGRLLLAKLLVICVVIALASRARSVVRARQKKEGSRAALRRSTVFELAAGVVVIAVTAVLVNTTPARTSYTPIVNTTVELPADVARHFGADSGKVRLRAAPARPGDNVLDLYLVADTGRLLRVQEVTARLDAVDKHVKGLPLKVSEAEPGHYVATEVTVPFRGRWTLHLDLRLTDFDEQSMTIGFRVR
jgi:copper transport protein